MKPSSEANFNSNYQAHLKHLKLKGLQPKTIDVYARAIRRLGAYFDYRIVVQGCGIKKEYAAQPAP